MKQDDERTKQLEDILDKLYENWREVRRETIAELGEAESLKIIDFHANNWIDITRWIGSKYERGEQMNIVSFQFSRCFKEIYWLQFLFQTGNYSTGYRNLRYVLEMMSQAYYVDAKYPDLGLDDQFARAREIEEHIWGWNIVKGALSLALSKRDSEVRACFKPLWNELNRYVHPSVALLDSIALQDFSSLVTDSFSRNLAIDFLHITDRVFDVTYAVVLKKFLKARESALGYEFLHEWEECLPTTMSVIRADY